MSLITPISLKSAIQLINVNYKDAYEQFQQHTNDNNQILFYPIIHLAESICKTLFLNNYEINIIIGAYLILWSKKQDKSGITKNELELCFETCNQGFIRYFFPENTINCNNFVIFVCFFLFYSSEDILSVLLAMSGVTSNLIITKEQVLKFLSNFGFSETFSRDLFIFLESSFSSFPDSSTSSDVYSIKLFTSYMKNSHTYIATIQNLKYEIGMFIFDNKTLKNIIAKTNYYNSVFDDMYKDSPDVSITTIHLTPKVENCCSKCIRVLFTNKPHPYHFDYCIDCSPFKAKSNILYQIKQRFGYSRRNSSTGFTSFSVTQSHSSNKQKDNSQPAPSNMRYYSLVNNKNRITPYSSDCVSKLT